MKHDEWLEQAESYVLGALDGAELAQFESHLASGCPLCEHHLRETRERLVLLPRSLTPLAPPPAVKARLLERIASEAAMPCPERPRAGWLRWMAGAGALAGASFLIILGWNLSVTRHELRKLEAQTADLRTQLAWREETLQLLLDPGVRVIQLAGPSAIYRAAGRLFWDPVTRTGILLTTGLPQAPPDSAYELWAIAGAEPVPAGVFRVGRGGRGFLKIPPLPEAKPFDKFVVTLEPAGGVQKPTGPMHLLGSP